jgi:hypothetical protein
MGNTSKPMTRIKTNTATKRKSLIGEEFQMNFQNRFGNLVHHFVDRSRADLRDDFVYIN